MCMQQLAGATLTFPLGASACPVPDQLLHEVRDTTCALLPSQWEGSEWEEQLVRAAQLHDDLASNVKDVPKSVGEPKGVLPLAPLASYMLCVSEQISMLAGPSRANEAAAWRDAVEAAAPSVHCVPAGGRSVELPLTNDADGEASLAVADAMAKCGTAALVGCGTLSHTPVTHTFDIGPSDEAPAVLLLRFFRSTFGQLRVRAAPSVKTALPICPGKMRSAARPRSIAPVEVCVNQLVAWCL